MLEYREGYRRGIIDAADSLTPLIAQCEHHASCAPKHLAPGLEALALAWDEDSDEKMIALIDQKIAEGVTFFLLKPKAAPTVKQKKLKKAKDALPDRAVVMADQDFAAMVLSGVATTREKRHAG